MGRSVGWSRGHQESGPSACCGELVDATTNAISRHFTGQKDELVGWFCNDRPGPSRRLGFWSLGEPQKFDAQNIELSYAWLDVTRI
jgi:hypothetical protein